MLVVEPFCRNFPTPKILLHLGGVPIEETQAPTWTHWPRPSAEKSGWTGYRVTFLVLLVPKHISEIWGMEWNMLCQVKPPLVFIGLDFYDFHHFLLRKVCDHPNGVSRFFSQWHPDFAKGGRIANMDSFKSSSWVKPSRSQKRNSKGKKRVMMRFSRYIWSTLSENIHVI